MSKSSDEDFLIEHKVPNLVDDLLKALLAERPSDVVDFSVSWLKNFSTDSKTMSSPPTLYYFPIAGRGEIARAICAVGELDYTDAMPGEDVDKLSFGSPGSLPLLEHGDLKIAQSFAVQAYLLDIAPKYSKLTAKQKAVDYMFMGFFEDLLGGFFKFLFAPDYPAGCKEGIEPVCKKWFSVIEAKTPAEGFVNGLEIPTTADLVILILAKGYMPYGACYKSAGIEDPFADYPKMQANLKRCMSYPAVQKYLESGKTMEAAGMGK